MIRFPAAALERLTLSETVGMRNMGAIITTALGVIDREQGGTDALAGAAITLRSMFTRSDFDRRST